ncbi:MAG: hypothetical protein RLZZ618_3083 [Pseudomonadota bacterium]|jgi:peptidoglycan/LPS O-acetylase OafA/YrhL
MVVSVKPRLGELEVMRAFAAITVLVFHYTVRFPGLYAVSLGLPEPVPTVLSRGGLGVNFFFSISGFVILLTLQTCKGATDFFVARLTRLLPTYWVSLAITFAVVAVFSLPGREVTGWQALGNITMFQEFFRIPHVDGVYWSLQVEVIFYIWMIVIFVAHRLDDIRHILWAWLGASLVIGLLNRHAGVDTPYILTKVFMLEYIAMFAVGLVAYRASQKGGIDGTDLLLWALAIAVSTVWRGRPAFIGSSVMVILFWLFIYQRLSWVACKPLIWFGSISYPFYLLHQNIGYVVIRESLLHGNSMAVGITCAVVISLVLSVLVSYGVEQPAMRYLRDVRYRQKLRRQAALQTP